MKTRVETNSRNETRTLYLDGREVAYAEKSGKVTLYKVVRGASYKVWQHEGGYGELSRIEQSAAEMASYGEWNDFVREWEGI